MSLVFKNIKPSEKTVKLLTYENVSFEDGYQEKYPVKKITITIEAGDVAKMEVERFVDLSSDINNPLYASVVRSGNSPVTFTNIYVLEDIEGIVNLFVTGPHNNLKTSKCDSNG